MAVPLPTRVTIVTQYAIKSYLGFVDVHGLGLGDGRPRQKLSVRPDAPLCEAPAEALDAAVQLRGVRRVELQL